MKPVEIEENQWHPSEDLDEVVNFIKLASSDPQYNSEGNHIPGKTYWSWIKNSKCKYVSIRFDMRDGAFVICDKDGNRINFSDLKYQYEYAAK